MTVPVRTPYLMLTAPREWRFAPVETAVVAIDFDDWAMCPDCGILGGAKLRGIEAEFVEYRSMLASAVQNLQTLARHARDGGCYVVALDRPDPMDTSGVGLAGLGGCVAEHDDVTEQFEHIHRSGASIFLDTPLEARLRERRVSTVILCGTMANRTVRLAADEALDRGFSPFVVMDASASESLDWHALLAMETNGGPMRVGFTDEVISLLQAGLA